MRRAHTCRPSDRSSRAPSAAAPSGDPRRPPGATSRSCAAWRDFPQLLVPVQPAKTRDSTWTVYPGVPSTRSVSAGRELSSPTISFRSFATPCSGSGPRGRDRVLLQCRRHQMARRDRRSPDHRAWAQEDARVEWAAQGRGHGRRRRATRLHAFLKQWSEMISNKFAAYASGARKPWLRKPLAPCGSCCLPGLRCWPPHVRRRWA